MLRPASKYQRLSFYILIISYIACSFPSPIYETIHFFAHLQQAAHSGFHFHSYHSHDHSHEHTAINIFDQNNEDHDDHFSTQEIKKKFERVKYFNFIAINGDRNVTHNFNYSFPFTAVFKEASSPPPEWS